MTKELWPDSLDHLLVKICRLHHTRAHGLFEAVGLHRGQPAVLRLLWAEEGRIHSELARQLHVQPATVTKMIQRMERAGFVVRRSDPDDERVSRVYLTETGRTIQADVQRIWQTLEEETFANFSVEERVLLHRFLAQIHDNLTQAIGEKSPN